MQITTFVLTNTNKLKPVYRRECL